MIRKIHLILLSTLSLRSIHFTNNVIPRVVEIFIINKCGDEETVKWRDKTCPVLPLFIIDKRRIVERYREVPFTHVSRGCNLKEVLALLRNRRYREASSDGTSKGFWLNRRSGVGWRAKRYRGGEWWKPIYRHLALKSLPELCKNRVRIVERHRIETQFFYLVSWGTKDFPSPPYLHRSITRKMA